MKFALAHGLGLGLSLAAGLAVSLIHCNKGSNSEQGVATASALPSGKQATAAPIQGTYRVDALMALNEKAIQDMGAPRVSMEESFRKSMEGGAYVFMRMVIKFSGEKIATRMDSTFKFQNGYQWGWCEGEGSVLWKGNELTLPGGVATRGDSGFVSSDDSHHGACNANIAAGTYTLKTEAGETRLCGSRDGAEFAFVLVKDDSEPNVEERSRALAGNPKK